MNFRHFRSFVLDTDRWDADAVPLPPKAEIPAELIEKREWIVLLDPYALPPLSKTHSLIERKLVVERWLLTVRLHRALNEAGITDVLPLLTAMGGARGAIYRQFAKRVRAVANDELRFLFELFTQWEIGGEDGEFFRPCGSMLFLRKLVAPSSVEAARINRWVETLPLDELHEAFNFRFYRAKQFEPERFRDKTVVEWRRFWLQVLAFIEKRREANKPVSPALLQFAKVELKDSDGRAEIVHEFDKILGYVAGWPDEEEGIQALTSKGLKSAFLLDLAIVSVASKTIGVALSTVQNAIAKGKLPSYRLAGDTQVVSLAECRKLWPQGAAKRPGRPRIQDNEPTTDPII